MSKLFFNHKKPSNRGKITSYDWVLVFIVSSLSIFGLAVLASSLSSKSQAEYQSIFFRQLFLGVGLGTVGSVILSRIDYHWILQKHRILLILNYCFLGFLALFAAFLFFRSWGLPSLSANSLKSQIIDGLTFLPIRPHIANGAIRWIDFPFLPNFQPSEFTKIAILVYFGYVFWKKDREKIGWMDLKKPIYALILSSLLILAQPDLGTTLLIFGIVLTGMWVSKVPLKIILTLGSLALALALISSFFVSYRVDRITAFFDPNTDEATQIRGVQQAVASGGLFGKGYGNSEFKHLPGRLFEQSTDSIIAIIGEEFGYVGTVIFVLMYIWLLQRGLKIARESPDAGGSALAAGIVFWITAQAFINIFGMLGLLPLKGIPLPFVSQGGSSIFLNLLAIGILLNISRQKLGVGD